MRVDVRRFRRTSVVNLLRTWRSLKGTARHAIKGEVRPGLPKEDMEYLCRRMVECAEGKGGEVSARARSAELGSFYLQLNKKGKERFLKMMGRVFTLEKDRVIAQLETLKNAKDEQHRNRYRIYRPILLRNPRGFRRFITGRIAFSRSII